MRPRSSIVRGAVQVAQLQLVTVTDRRTDILIANAAAAALHYVFTLRHQKCQRRHF